MAAQTNSFTRRSLVLKRIKNIAILVILNEIFLGFGIPFFIACVSALFQLAARFMRNAINRPARKELVPVKYLVVSSILWFLISGATIADMLTAQDRATEVVLAIEEYKLDTGHYPASLEKLTPVYFTFIPRARYTRYLLGEFMLWPHNKIASSLFTVGKQFHLRQVEV